MSSFVDRLKNNPALVDALLSEMQFAVMGAGLMYAMPLEKAKEKDALRQIILAWAARVEGEQSC